MLSQAPCVTTQVCVCVSLPWCSVLVGYKWPQIPRGNHTGCVMTMCVHSINPFLTGTRTTLAENVITLLHRRCSVGRFCRGGTWLVTEAEVRLLPHPHQQLWHACNVRGRLRKRRFPRLLSEAEREPVANDSMMCNADDAVRCRLFGVRWRATWRELKGRIRHQRTVVTKRRVFSLSQNAKRVPAARGCCLLLMDLTGKGQKRDSLTYSATEESDWCGNRSLKWNENT